MRNCDEILAETQKNGEYWAQKPVLRKIYHQFYKTISEHLVFNDQKFTAEIGSGLGNIKEVIPHCIKTDIFKSHAIDEAQNAYRLSWKDESLCNLILFDVFHHLRYPGIALNEFQRVLMPGGRVIIFEPCVSLLGILVYGLLHKEPLALKDQIHWYSPETWDKNGADDYAAQGNASRVFLKQDFSEHLAKWSIKKTARFSAISYVLSGGYSKPQIYPDIAYPIFKCIDKICNILPSIFATRLLVVLEKK